MASTANSNAEKPCCRASADGVTRCARRARARTLMHRRFGRLAIDAEAAVNYLKFIQEHKKVEVTIAAGVFADMKGACQPRIAQP